MCCSKTLACESGIVRALCQLLSVSSLNSKTAVELVHWLEILASHSLTAYELKQIFLLLRDEKDIKVQQIKYLYSIDEKGNI